MAGDNEPQGQHYNFDTGDLVESSETWWKARAKTAIAAADELEALASRVDNLFTANYWGDCIEGRTTHQLFWRSCRHLGRQLEGTGNFCTEPLNRMH